MKYQDAVWLSYPHRVCRALTVGAAIGRAAFPRLLRLLLLPAALRLLRPTSAGGQTVAIEHRCCRRRRRGDRANFAPEKPRNINAKEAAHRHRAAAGQRRHLGTRPESESKIHRQTADISSHVPHDREPGSGGVRLRPRTQETNHAVHH